MRKEAKGTILVLLTALISGFAIVANKLFVVGIDPSVFTAVRALIIGLVFLGLTLYTNKKAGKSFKKINWKYLAVIGVVGGGLAFLSFFTGLQLTTAGRAAFLHKTLPLYVTILAFIFLKERVTKKQGYALLLMIAGTFAIVFSSIQLSDLWANPSLGDGLVIFATILWGIENVLAKKAMSLKETNWAVSFGRMFIGAIFLFIAVLFLGKAVVLLTLTQTQIVNILISTAILFGYVLTYYWSLKYINVSKAASILLLTPVVSLVLGMLVFGEPVAGLQIVGSAAILIGAYSLIKVKSKSREKPEVEFKATI